MLWSGSEPKSHYKKKRGGKWPDFSRHYFVLISTHSYSRSPSRFGPGLRHVCKCHNWERCGSNHRHERGLTFPLAARELPHRWESQAEACWSASNHGADRLSSLRQAFHVHAKKTSLDILNCAWRWLGMKLAKDTKQHMLEGVTLQTVSVLSSELILETRKVNKC